MNSKANPWLAVGIVSVIALLAIVATYFAIWRFHSSSLQILAIWSLGWLSHVVIVAFLISRLLKQQHRLLAQAVCLVAVAVNLILIFSLSPMDLLPEFQSFAKEPPAVERDSTAVRFLIEENKKAVEEIKSRDEEEDSWFHNKFILVGGLLAATLGYIGFGQQAPDSAEKRMAALSKSPSTVVVLSLACVITLGIDMHVRGNLCVTDQIGLWLRYYVEPALLHGQPVSDGKPMLPTFYGWEEFLRTNVSTPSAFQWDNPPSQGAGLHSSELWNLLYEPHVHFLTAFVYLLYLWTFQRFAHRSLGRTEEVADYRLMAIVCFAVVHFSFAAFTWIAHIGPEMFRFKLLPFTNAWDAGYIVPLYYFPACIALALLNVPYLVSYYRLDNVSREYGAPAVQ